MKSHRKLERQLRRQLRDEEVPDADQARETARKLIRSAYSEREVSGSPRGAWRRPLQLAIVFGLVALVVSPAGAAVRDWVSEAVSPGQENAKPALTRLPAPGRLLVKSEEGIWVGNRDGSKRLLGDFEDATWSPRGLFVAATTGHQLVALDPGGQVRWTLSKNGLVSNPSWNKPDGFRVAYLEGDSLRVVAGDGSGDRLLDRGVALLTPAWKPGPRYQVAYARPDGSVIVTAAESGRKIFEISPPGQVGADSPIRLQWSEDGRRLLVIRPTGLEQYRDDGELIWSRKAAEDSMITDGQFEPGGQSVAIATSLETGGRSRADLVGPGRGTRNLFSGPGQFSDLSWSPNGERLLLGWQSADQWLFLSPDRPRGILAVSNISSQFAPGSNAADRSFPTVEGWCCSR